jgi:hypothetical protein
MPSIVVIYATLGQNCDKYGKSGTPEPVSAESPMVEWWAVNSIRMAGYAIFEMGVPIGGKFH